MSICTMSVGPCESSFHSRASVWDAVCQHLDVQPLTPPLARLLSGDEAIVGAGTDLREFWAWTLSDLLSNTTRPMLAEFLVAKAMGAAGRPRIEWDAYDVLAGDIRIEVKSAAALQSWKQMRPSRIVFGGLTGRFETDGGWTTTATYNADVYVFAVVSETDHSRYNPLDVGNWTFWVAGRDAVAATGCNSLGLPRVRTIAEGPVGYADLADAVHRHGKPGDERRSRAESAPGL